ncbi:ubiquitin carboxyl-terminal hydrolase 47-like isoform X2 [Epinephelus lanceolatus]
MTGALPASQGLLLRGCRWILLDLGRTLYVTAPCCSRLLSSTFQASRSSSRTSLLTDTCAVRGAALWRRLRSVSTFLWGYGAALRRRLQSVSTFLWGYGAQPHRLPHGLHNQGATCYLNSVLQVLVMTTEIHDRLDHDSQTDQQLKQIFEELKRKTCTTETITAAFGITNGELIRMLCDDRDFHAKVFQGELTHTTECSKGHSINEETNPFWTLPLSLQDTHDTTYSVERSFERIFQQKSFSGDNMVYCNECEEKTEATSGCEMVKYPQILTLLFKRFDFDYRTMSYFKSHRCVDVPRTLQRKDKEYKLYGMVHHNGSLTGGHYTATILCSEDKTWYEFNDAHVSKVKRQPFAETSPYKSQTAYLLMYRGAE